MIDSASMLAAFLPRLRAAEWIALDTEADSLHAYPEKLCLLQIALPAECVLLDPLASLDLKPVFEVLARHEIILHGGDYDLRLLWKDCQFAPRTVFDTMFAARLLGCREFGLNSLLSKFLGITLEKGSQKANWARRPLTPKMADYALNDVRHLKALSDLLRQQLMEKGRIEWHQQFCAQIITESTRSEKPDPNTVWRVKGSHGLPPRALAVVRALWHWREHEALAAGKPPFFILSPAQIVDMAVEVTTDGDVSRLVPRHFSPRRRQTLFKALDEGMTAPHPPHPIKQKSHRQTEAERRRFVELEKRRNRRAHDLGIDPTIIASRSTLVLLAHQWEKHSAELLPWQRQLLEP